MFEKLEEKLTMLGNSMKSGASNFTENINLNAKIDDSKKKIATLYGEIGEKFYLENKDSVPKGYEEKFEKVSGYFKDIDDAADQIKKLAGIRICPTCGADVAKGYRFCIACGTRVPEEEKPEEKTAPVCEKCGAEAEEGAVYCINCGAKLPPVKEKKQDRFCVRCGSKLMDGALFCTTCGEKVEIEPEPLPEEIIPAEEIPDPEIPAEEVSEPGTFAEEAQETAAEAEMPEGPEE